MLLSIDAGTLMVALLLVGLLMLVALAFDEDVAAVLVTATMSLGCVLLFLTASAACAWFFKDGLGPGFIPSEGPEAVLRFMEGYWPPLVVGLAEGALVVVACRRRMNALRRRLGAR